VIALVTGPDAATARERASALAREHDPSGTNTTRVDGRTASLPGLISQVGSVGFFAERRVVVVEDLMGRAAKPARAAADDEAGEASPPALDVAPLFAATLPENLLVLVDAALSGVPAAIKRAAPPDATVVVCEPPRGAELIAWLARVARDEGGELPQPAARHLAARVYPQTWSSRPNNPRYDRPPDLDRLRGEVAKLVAYAHPGPVTREHVETLVAAGDEDQIFRFGDAVARGQLGPALTELARLLDAGEEPYRVAAQLYQQAELALALDAAGPGREPVAVGRALGLSNPNRMLGIAGTQRGRPSGTAARALAAALAVDRATKRGELRQPEDALYALVARNAGDA
jgi:DNA polymerase III delta subunit